MNWTKRLPLLGVLCVGLSGCGGSLTANSVQGRFVNFVPDGPRLDFFANGARLSQGKGYLDGTGYVVVKSGTTNFSVVATGGGPVLAQTSLNTAAPQQYTIAAIGRANPPVGQPGYSLVALREENIAPPTGVARFRVAHVAPSTAALDWYVTLDGVNLDSVAPDFTDIQFAEASPYLNSELGQRRIRATLTGTKTVVYDTTFTFAGRNIYSLYLRDASTGGGPVQGKFVIDGK